VQIPGWTLLAYLIYAQAIPAFNYDLGVRMGTQESAQRITEVGVAFWYGFALADLLVYIPLLGLGLVGHRLRRPWWKVVLGAALGITVYWPVVVLAAAVDATGVTGWEINTSAYWLVLSPIICWALLSLILVARDPSGGIRASHQT
jgi:hypothetical protein